MKLNSLFASDANISPADVKKYMTEHTSEEYQLLDVRQPGEYAKEHLPGAKLIPVKNLMDRLAELDPEKPVFVY